MKPLMIASLVVVLLAAGCATQESASPSGDADRTVVVTMRDIEFEPNELTVTQGETIALRFVNRGRLPHDAFIGNEGEQEEHEDEARAAEEEGHAGHAEDDPTAITVEPGDTGTLTYTFDRAGKTLIGCHEPGHYDDGMKVDVTVEAAT